MLMRKYILFMFLCLHYVARGQTESLTCRFMVDNKPLTEKKVSAKNATTAFDLDMSALPEGLHTLSAQLVTPDGAVASVLRDIFYRTVPWIDTSVKSLTCRFMVDNKPLTERTIPATSATTTFDLDLSTLPEGLHTLSAQVVTPTGEVTSSLRDIFYRVPANKGSIVTKCYYKIDKGDYVYEAEISDDGTYQFNLDLASLDLGLHRLTIMLSDDKVTYSTLSETFFVEKMPESGGNISQYGYWLNDDATTYTSVDIVKPVPTFTLIKQLPLPQQPFSSQRYAFCIENGQPTVYGQNDFHIRFFDSNGGMVDGVERYSDARVKETLTDLPVIQSEVTATINRPEENTIKWFTFNASWSDSLIFKADQRCMIEVYSPSAQKVYSSSGEASTAFEGCHAAEDGTYYLAIHDVEGNASSINIDYLRIDKDCIVLDEKATSAPTDTTNVFVRVKRTLTASKWNSVVFPFDMNSQQITAAFGADVRILDFTGHEAVKDAKGKTNYIKVYFSTRSIDQGIKSNHPYLIKVKNKVSEWMLNGVNITVDDNPVNAALERTDTEWSEFTGTYAANTAVPANCLYLNSDKFYYSTGSTRINAFNAYFDLSDVLDDRSGTYTNNIELCIDGGMNPTDWAILNEVYANLDGEKTWTRKWNLGDDAGSATTLPGVTMENNRVTAIDLSSNNLKGEFPYALLKLEKLQSLNLSNNTLTGDIGASLTQYAKANGGFKPGLINLNISHNALKGNIGEFAGHCSTLAKLDASYNRFSEVDPMIAKTVSLTLDHQTLDTQAIHATDAPWQLTELPSILFYNHSEQDFSENLSLNLTAEGWGMNMAWQNGKMVVGGTGKNNAYKGANGATVTATLNSGNITANATTFPLDFSFDMGDANFIDGVNAADLQATILYALNDYTKLFNFTAADTHSDEDINVLDVVSTVNIMLEEMPVNSEEVNRRESIEEQPIADASVFVREGQLILQSSVPVAAIDIKTSDRVAWNIERYGLTQTTTERALVGYSLNGATLPAGEVVLGKCTGNVKVLSVSAADAEANSISVAITDGTATTIEDIDDDGTTDETYTVAGIRTNTKEGVRIIRKNGRTVKVYYNKNK